MCGTTDGSPFIFEQTAQLLTWMCRILPTMNGFRLVPMANLIDGSNVCTYTTGYDSSVNGPECLLES